MWNIASMSPGQKYLKLAGDIRNYQISGIYYANLINNFCVNRKRYKKLWIYQSSMKPSLQFLKY